MLPCASREDACDLLFMLTLTGATSRSSAVSRPEIFEVAIYCGITFPPKAADKDAWERKTLPRGNAKTVTIRDSHHRGQAAVLETEAGLKSR